MLSQFPGIRHALRFSSWKITCRCLHYTVSNTVISQRRSCDHMIAALCTAHAWVKVQFDLYQAFATSLACSTLVRLFDYFRKKGQFLFIHSIWDLTNYYFYRKFIFSWYAHTWHHTQTCLSGLQFFLLHTDYLFPDKNCSSNEVEGREDNQSSHKGNSSELEGRTHFEVFLAIYKLILHFWSDIYGKTFPKLLSFLEDMSHNSPAAKRPRSSEKTSTQTLTEIGGKIELKFNFFHYCKILLIISGHLPAHSIFGTKSHVLLVTWLLTWLVWLVWLVVTWLLVTIITWIMLF